jgi:site-specific DNA-methyltransferase (adenine-specific)
MTHQIEFTPIASIIIGERARKEFTKEGLQTLSDALGTKIGMLHPILLLDNNTLLTGERRLRVVTSYHELMQPVNFAGTPIPYNCIPTIRVTSAFDAVEYLISEESENDARVNFTWIESVALTKRIADLKQLQAKLVKEEPVNIKQLLEDIGEDAPEYDEDGDLIPQRKVSVAGINSMLALQSNPKKAEITLATVKEVAKQLHGESKGGLHRVQADLKMSAALEIPELAASLCKATSRKEANKILEREEKHLAQSRLAQQQGKTLQVGQHKVFHGDCLEIMKGFPDASIDVCLTEPDAGLYDVTALGLVFAEISRVLKPAAHIYMFCDCKDFTTFSEQLTAQTHHNAQWQVQPFPIAWINTSGTRSPVQGFTFRKSVEWILFAYRGGKQSNSQLDGHFEVSSKRTENNGAAKDPSGLRILLNNSAFPSAVILDPFAGSGGTMLAANECKMRSVSIEQNVVDYGRCIERLREIER